MSTVQRGKIIRSDQAKWDGKTKTSSRVDATGGTVTGLTVDDYVDVLQVFGSGTTYTDATITAALNHVGTANNMTLLWSSGTWTLNESHTIPANLASHVTGGCVFSILSGKTLTFSGPVHVDFSTSTGTGWYTGDGVVSCTLGASGFPGW
jgi:hypothetical protein